LKFPATNFSVCIPLRKFLETFKIFNLGNIANENHRSEALYSEPKELKLKSKSSNADKCNSSGNSFKSLPDRLRVLGFKFYQQNERKENLNKGKVKRFLISKNWILLKERSKLWRPKKTSGFSIGILSNKLDLNFKTLRTGKFLRSLILMQFSLRSNSSRFTKYFKSSTFISVIFWSFFEKNRFLELYMISIINTW